MPRIFMAGAGVPGWLDKIGAGGAGAGLLALVVIAYWLIQAIKVKNGNGKRPPASDSGSIRDMTVDRVHADLLAKMVEVCERMAKISVHLEDLGPIRERQAAIGQDLANLVLRIELQGRGGSGNG